MKTSGKSKSKTYQIGNSKIDLSAKKGVDSMIKELEKEMNGVQTDVVDGFNKLERKI